MSKPRETVGPHKRADEPDPDVKARAEADVKETAATEKAAKKSTPTKSEA